MLKMLCSKQNELEFLIFGADFENLLIFKWKFRRQVWRNFMVFYQVEWEFMNNGWLKKFNELKNEFRIEHYRCFLRTFYHTCSWRKSLSHPSLSAEYWNREIFTSSIIAKRPVCEADPTISWLLVRVMMSGPMTVRLWLVRDWNYDEIAKLFDNQFETCQIYSICFLIDLLIPNHGIKL